MEENLVLSNYENNVVVVVVIVTAMALGGSAACGRGRGLWSQTCGFGRCSEFNGVFTKFMSFLSPHSVALFGNRAMEEVIN